MYYILVCTGALCYCKIYCSLSLLFDLHYIWHDIIIWWCRCLEWNAIIFHTQHKKKLYTRFFFWTSLRFVLKILFSKTQQCYHHHIIFDTLKNNSLICCYVIFRFLWKKSRKITKKNATMSRQTCPSIL